MNASIEVLIAQIAEVYDLLVTEIKLHQEALDTAQHDVQRLARVLAFLQAEEEPCCQSTIEMPLAVTIDGEQDGESDHVTVHERVTEHPLAVPHTIDMRLLARSLPRTNPFADRPDSLPWAMWEVMKAGGLWHVTKDLRPALSASGVIVGESTIYNVFRREPTVFQGVGGTYHVTSAFAVPSEES